MDLYTERVHVVVDEDIQPALLVILNRCLHMFSMDGLSQQRMSINVITEIVSIEKCIRQSKVDQLQASCFQLTGKQDSLIVIQDSNDCFKRLVDFINYKIY